MPRVALVVEDDPELQRAIGDYLRKLGFAVLGALHYEGAAAYLESARPAFACVDLELPTASGYEVCELIRRSGYADVPILVTSDSDDPEHMAYAERAGANAFLRKPFSTRELGRYVRALLEKSKRSEPRLRRLRP